MAALRIGIDVGGTFTHGVVLRPPGEVLASARTPTTHAHAQGVAAGVQAVLGELLAALGPLGCTPADVALVAHSTTQATNALLEGDVAPVARLVLVPPGEGLLCRNALRAARLDIGNGHAITLMTRFIPWETAGGSVPDGCMAGCPVAVVQPLAGGQELRESAVAEACRAQGLAAVCAGDITQVLGLAARARTAAVNASMLPKMLATAEYTAAAVAALLPGVPLQVVRSDGGAMDLGEMRRLPVLSLLSGPAAGASAALHRTGLSEVVFLEVGGTSTDITLIKEGRVRHRYATVGGQRLMVPALDLRTVAVGGGSMLRADGARFGPRSAHIAGLPYLFQALAAGKQVKSWHTWSEDGAIGPIDGEPLELPLGVKVEPVVIGNTLVTWSNLKPGKGCAYWIAALDDGSFAALTLTDYYIAQQAADAQELQALLGAAPETQSHSALQQAVRDSRLQPHIARALEGTWRLVTDAVRELVRAHGADLATCTVVGGGGGAPVVAPPVAAKLGLRHSLVADHTVISAIGAALAVSCVSLSKSVSQPTSADIAGLLAEAERRLTAQGAERVSTDYEYDAHRQVLTVTARGSRPYEQSAQPRSAAQLGELARELLGSAAQLAWEGANEQLWLSAAPPWRSRRRAPRGSGACVLDSCGRALWTGWLRGHVPAAPGALEAELGRIVEQRTQYTDGGPALPGLMLVCAGRLVPLDQLGAKELIADVLRWENLPARAPGCYLLRE